MTELIRTHATRVRTPEDEAFTPETHGAELPDGQWIGWLEFLPVDGTGPTLRTARETTQPTRAALESWAAGLKRTYVVGAFERARIMTRISKR